MPSATPISDAPYTLRGAHILLVEDDEVSQALTCAMLRKAGFEVDVADDGQRAVQLVQQRMAVQRPYDLVLMDLQLPFMDGVAATRQMRCTVAATALPIVALTGSVLPADHARCLAAGMNAVVTKPVRAETLRRALGAWVRGCPEPGLAAKAARNAVENTATEPVLDALMARLRTVPQLDAAQGLLRAQNQPTLYASLLRRFVRSNHDLPARLRLCLADGDTMGAMRLAHSLKSAAANLGAKPLQRSAGVLESALHSGTGSHTVSRALNRTQRRLEDLLLTLKRTPGLLEAPPPADTARLTNAEQQTGQQLVDAVRKHLMNCDASAVQLWSAHAPLLRALHSNWQAVEAALNAFNWDTAVALLDRNTGSIP